MYVLGKEGGGKEGKAEREGEGAGGMAWKGGGGVSREKRDRGG